MTDDVDMDELNERAKVLAEATGRSVEDVMADLLDDGILNESNREKDGPKDLITQLKEAAALITTVQEINKEVSENKVLNGGENKTDVKIETTLEGDIVDRAIASAQRKADDLKKLVATLIPVFLLLTGGSLEAFGVTDFVGSSDTDDYDDGEPYVEYGGCTAPDADNYDPDADFDDGSCYWDDDPNDCQPNWWWQNEAIFDHDHDGQGFNNDLRVQVDFRDLNSCNEHMNNGYFEIMVGDEDRILEYNFHDQFTINEHYLNLAPGDYYVTIDYHTHDGSHWAGPTAWVTMEDEPEPEPVYGCTDPEATNHDPEADTDDGTCTYPPEECRIVLSDLTADVFENTVDVSVFVDVDESTDCPDDLDLVITITSDNGPYEYSTTVPASDATRSHTFQFVYNGQWIPSVSLSDGGQQIVYDDSEAFTVDYDPPCDQPFLYSIQGYKTADTFRVEYDPDCPGSSELDIDVSLEARAADSTVVLKVTNQSRTISGASFDQWTITVEDFIQTGVDTYDFTWSMSYRDSDGIDWIEYRNWSDVSFDAPEPPAPCDNLTITSESLTLHAYGDDLGITWNLTHDGPRTSDCFVEVEIFITLYQNGTYYDVSEYSDNPTFMVHNNHDGNQTLFFGPTEVALFENLADGEYEVLTKWRIKDTGETSDDHFANKVFIGTQS